MTAICEMVGLHDEDDFFDRRRYSWNGSWISAGARTMDDLIRKLESEAAWLRKAAAAGVRRDERAGRDARYFFLVAPSLRVARRVWRYGEESPASPAVQPPEPPRPEDPVPEAGPTAGPFYWTLWTGRCLAQGVETVAELADVVAREAALIREMRDAGVAADPDMVVSDKDIALVTRDPAVAARFGLEEWKEEDWE